jgi:D-glycero-D-manno-heptose 1,7-bisphosphate phosphatase
MLLRAAREHQIDLSASWMIGDSDIDIEAGKSAGCRTARLLEPDQAAGTTSDVMSSTLLQAVEKIISLENVHKSTSISHVS